MDMNFQTVFSTAVEDETNFDTIFGGEEDEELMDIVLGEDGENDMETLDDGIGAGELEDEVTGDESEKPTIDSNDEFEIDDFEAPGENIDCDKYGVADANDSSEPDEEDIECGEFDKAEKDSGIDDLDEAANELFSLDEGKCSAKKEEDEDVAAQDEIPEEETEESFEFGLEDSLFTESDDEETPDEEDSDEGEEDTDDDETEEEESALLDLDEATNELFSLDEGECSSKKEEDGDNPATQDEIPEEETEEAAFDLDEAANELFSESEEEIEDTIIDTVEDNDETMSDAEADSFESVEDDDIIDSILGED